MSLVNLYLSTQWRITMIIEPAKEKGAKKPAAPYEKETAIGIIVIAAIVIPWMASSAINAPREAAKAATARQASDQAMLAEYQQCWASSSKQIAELASCTEEAKSKVQTDAALRVVNEMAYQWSLGR
jgi:hypothetical protein